MLIIFTWIGWSNCISRHTNPILRSGRPVNMLAFILILSCTCFLCHSSFYSTAAPSHRCWNCCWAAPWCACGTTSFPGCHQQFRFLCFGWSLCTLDWLPCGHAASSPCCTVCFGCSKWFWSLNHTRRLRSAELFLWGHTALLTPRCTDQWLGCLRSISVPNPSLWYCLNRLGSPFGFSKHWLWHPTASSHRL